MGAWAILACLAPRVAILGVALDLGPVQRAMGDAACSRPRNGTHVRYVMPMAAMVLAAGLIGYCATGELVTAASRRPSLMVMAWICAALFCGVGLRDVTNRLSRVPVPIDREEAEQVWAWIRQVGDDDAVMVDYELSAPLSSRRQIYGCELDANLPKGFPQLGPEFRWLFIRNTNRFYNLLLEQGFEVVHQGKLRDRCPAQRWRSRHEIPIFSDFARTRTLDKMSIDRTAEGWRRDREPFDSDRSSPSAVEANRVV